MANFNINETVNGLGTTTITVPAAGRYSIEGKISLPSIVAGNSANSSVVAVVNQNGSPIYTGVAGAKGFRVNPFCSASDVITIVLSSANTVDLGLNVVKTTISVSDGV